MRRREVVIDVVVAVAAFAISALILADADPSNNDLRAPNVAAYVLAAVYSASVVVRRRTPVAAVAGGLLVAVVYALANYPRALTPIVLLSIFTSGATLPTRRARALLGGAVILGLLQTSLGPDLRISACPRSSCRPGSSAAT